MSTKFHFSLPFLACFALLGACEGGDGGDGVPIVIEVWHLGGFEAPESVVYDRTSEVF